LAIIRCDDAFFHGKCTAEVEEASIADGQDDDDAIISSWKALKDPTT
jgi:hypothetical protein